MIAAKARFQPRYKLLLEALLMQMLLMCAAAALLIEGSRLLKGQLWALEEESCLSLLATSESLLEKLSTRSGVFEVNGRRVAALFYTPSNEMERLGTAAGLRLPPLSAFARSGDYMGYLYDGRPLLVAARERNGRLVGIIYNLGPYRVTVGAINRAVLAALVAFYALSILAALLYYRRGLARLDYLRIRNEFCEASRRFYAGTVLDPLSGLYNSRALEESFRGEMFKARRFGLDLSLIYINIEGFSEINRQFGYGVGNSVLAATGRIIARLAAPDAVAGRIQADEFAVIKLASRQAAEALAAELKSSLEAEPLSAVGCSKPLRARVLTISCAPEDGPDFEAALETARNALLAARAAARAGGSGTGPASVRPALELL